MYFELNRHPAHAARTKIEFWGGLISDLEHCGLVEEYHGQQTETSYLRLQMLQIHPNERHMRSSEFHQNFHRMKF